MKHIVITLVSIILILNFIAYLVLSSTHTSGIQFGFKVLLFSFSITLLLLFLLLFTEFKLGSFSCFNFKFILVLFASLIAGSFYSHYFTFTLGFIELIFHFKPIYNKMIDVLIFSVLVFCLFQNIDRYISSYFKEDI